ncbi:radical SAM family heme chaperone HemW [Flexithrix dorotheae]|uniref:radical SAM family heme chaperone HemW n=1 Tax=Flexithrix dorotheae TaxID=70993 RepID=UPI00036EDF31|nr:radical SAM family heme chaperone HemW [Flexithrix dorotheae]
MAGIYLHIPYCKKACHYCDFHFSTNFSTKNELVDAISEELKIQKAFINSDIETVYFGGGTPSLLSLEELSIIFNAIWKNFNIVENAEITLECNPDDLSSQKLKDLQNLGVNRLSIGVQTFDNELLKFLNRAHSSIEAENAIKKAQDQGFENITIDLIYGIPNNSHNVLETDLKKAISLEVPHISAYCLTIEERTVFGNWLKKGKINSPNEDFEAEQFEIVVDYLRRNGYEQYEISNFARDKKYSKHNSNYWNQTSYLGIGPGAHSFNGEIRQFNIRNNSKYIKSIMKGIIPAEIEYLSQNEKVNEFILTTLRTIWGSNLDFIKSRYNIDLLTLKQKELEDFVKFNLVSLLDNHIVLTDKGKLQADWITSKLFL